MATYHCSRSIRARIVYRMPLYSTAWRLARIGSRTRGSAFRMGWAHLPCGLWTEQVNAAASYASYLPGLSKKPPPLFIVATALDRSSPLSISRMSLGLGERRPELLQRSSLASTSRFERLLGGRGSSLSLAAWTLACKALPDNSNRAISGPSFPAAFPE